MRNHTKKTCWKFYVELTQKGVRTDEAEPGSVIGENLKTTGTRGLDGGPRGPRWRGVGRYTVGKSLTVSLPTKTSDVKRDESRGS